MRSMSPMIVMFSFVMLLLFIVAPANSIMVIPNNTSATQLGGVNNEYTFKLGDDTVEVFTLLPLTSQDVAYPLDFWYACWFGSLACLILGILMAAFRDHVPSISLTAFGILAFGGFLTCALMLPYVADLSVHQQILQNVNTAGVPIGNNSIYVVQTANYPASPVHAIICWGLSIAGFIEAILGTLSFFGYLHRKGLKDASEGNYVETDIEGGGQDPSSLQYKRLGTGKAKR